MGRDAESVQRTEPGRGPGCNGEQRRADGAQTGEMLSGPPRPAPAEPPAPRPDGRAGGLPPGFLQETRGSQRFACTSRERLLLQRARSHAGPGRATAATGARRPLRPAPACGCLLLTSLCSLLGLRSLARAGRRPGGAGRAPAVGGVQSMHIYLGSALVVIGQLVEVVIVPFFTLMNNVHRENMQTQKKIING